MRPFRGVFSLFAYIRKEVWLLPQNCINEKGDVPGFQKETEVRMKIKRTKRKNKYTELRAAIAAVRKVNKGLLRVLPQWPEGWGEPQHSSDRFAAASPVHNPPQVKENVAAFFRGGLKVSGTTGRVKVVWLMAVGVARGCD